MKGLSHPLSDKQSLRGVLQKNRIAGDERRRKRVDRGHVRIVPRCDDQNDTMGNASDVALKLRIVRNRNVGQRLLGDLRHMAGPFANATKLTAISNGAAHLFCQFRNDLIVQIADGPNTRHHQIDAFIQRSCGPSNLCIGKPSSDSLCVIVAGKRPLRENRSIDGGYALDAVRHCLCSAHALSKPRAIS